mgnify:CR=1 FL=1
MRGRISQRCAVRLAQRPRCADVYSPGREYPDASHLLRRHSRLRRSDDRSRRVLVVALNVVALNAALQTKLARKLPLAFLSATSLLKRKDTDKMVDSIVRRSPTKL